MTPATDRAWHKRATSAQRKEIEGIDRLILLLRKRRQAVISAIKMRTAVWARRHAQ